MTGDRPDVRLALVGGLATLAALIIYQVWPASSADRCADVPGGTGNGPLTVLGGKDDSGIRRALIEGWQGSDGTRATFRELPENTDLERGELIATARSGGCDADLFILDTPWIPEFARSGYIDAVGIPERDLRGIMPRILDTGRYDGRLWGVPLNTDAPLLVYRKDLVKTVPRNWQEIETEARAQANRPGNHLTGGYTLQFDTYEGFVVNFLELVRAHGGDITVGENGKVALDRRAMTGTLNDLAAAMRGPHPVISRDALQANEARSRDAFKVGQVALMRNWPASYALIAGSGTVAPGTIGVVPFPGPKVLGGQSLVISASLPDGRVRAARELIKYLTAGEQQRRMFACGGWAAVRDDVYRSGSDACPDQGTKNKRVILHAPAEVIRQAVKEARPRPSLPFYPEFSRVLQTRLHERLECMVEGRPCQPEDAGEFLDRLTSDLEKAAQGRAS